jgi:hypothetical protein
MTEPNNWLIITGVQDHRMVMTEFRKLHTFPLPQYPVHFEFEWYFDDWDMQHEPTPEAIRIARSLEPLLQEHIEKKNRGILYMAKTSFRGMCWSWYITPDAEQPLEQLFNDVQIGDQQQFTFEMYTDKDWRNYKNLNSAFQSSSNEQPDKKMS